MADVDDNDDAEFCSTKFMDKLVIFCYFLQQGFNLCTYTS